jgi:hypothetical protein
MIETPGAARQFLRSKRIECTIRKQEDPDRLYTQYDYAAEFRKKQPPRMLKVVFTDEWLGPYIRPGVLHALQVVHFHMLEPLVRMYEHMWKNNDYLHRDFVRQWVHEHIHFFTAEELSVIMTQTSPYCGNAFVGRVVKKYGERKGGELIWRMVYERKDNPNPIVLRE